MPAVEKVCLEGFLPLKVCAPRMLSISDSSQVGACVNALRARQESVLITALTTLNNANQGRSLKEILSLSSDEV